MKYIRTKDGRIVKVPNNAGIILYDDEKLLIDTKQKSQTCVYGIVEKQADTIEELCDEFVVKMAYRINKPFIADTSYDFIHKSYNKNGGEVYGAIWTDKGLIFVARMNNEGVLELL